MGLYIHLLKGKGVYVNELTTIVKTTTVKNLALITFALFLLCNCNYKKTEKATNQEKLKKIEKNEISKALKEFISINYSNYEIPTEAEFIKDWKSYCLENNKPYCCSSDFNGDGQLDHCLILKNPDKELKVIAFIKQENTYLSYELDSFPIEENIIDICIAIEKKGIWEGIDEVVNVPNDAILVELISESMSKAYYWEKSKFEVFTAD